MRPIRIFLPLLLVFTSAPAGANLSLEESDEKLWLLNAMVSIHYNSGSKSTDSVYLRFKTKERCEVAARSFESNQKKRMYFRRTQTSYEGIAANCSNLDSGVIEFVIDCAEYKRGEDGGTYCHKDRLSK